MRGLLLLLLLLLPLLLLLLLLPERVSDGLSLSLMVVDSDAGARVS